MSVFTSLYRGETRFNFIGTRRKWYFASAVVMVLCIVSIVFRQFNVGIDFKGGTQFQVPRTGIVTKAAVESAFPKSGFEADGAAQEVGSSGGAKSVIIKSHELNPQQQVKVQQTLANELKIKADDISIESVSSTWGAEITRKSIQGLVIFLVFVFFYITIRFEWKMAVAALVALAHDLLISAGVYSIVGFELTPSTIVGLLTILGFSLYDTVVVYDKVRENTRDLSATARMTYDEAANLAVNQTLMRSINTSLISLLPVAGLLFVGAGLLGVGTLKDLALILFIGLAVGGYSSLFLATPLVVDLKHNEPEIVGIAKRVQARRSSAAARGDIDPDAVVVAPVRRGAPAPAPKPGARPDRKRK